MMHSLPTDSGDIINTHTNLAMPPLPSPPAEINNSINASPSQESTTQNMFIFSNNVNQQDTYTNQIDSTDKILYPTSYCIDHNNVINITPMNETNPSSNINNTNNDQTPNVNIHQKQVYIPGAFKVTKYIPLNYIPRNKVTDAHVLSITVSRNQHTVYSKQHKIDTEQSIRLLKNYFNDFARQRIIQV